MVEVIDPGVRITLLMQKASAADVPEGLRSVHELAPYLDNPWRSRGETADGCKVTGMFSCAAPQVGGVEISNAAARYEVPAGFNVWVPSGFATTFAYDNQLSEDRPKRSSRKTCHPAYMTSGHSRCTGYQKVNQANTENFE
jgi:hypothetical protein